MRFAVDTGGTFTDLVVEQDDGALRLFKAQTTPHDPIIGVLDSLQVAADAYDLKLKDLLSRGSMFIHGTTRAINAIVTKTTARTALLVTAGHPDILVLREGGRNEVFNFAVEFPDPYIPRSLTFEVSERVTADGSVLQPLDEAALVRTIGELKQQKVEAVAICLLWSIVNPAHERRVGMLLEQHLPGVPYTLSHQINPSLREYRRASSAAIDASLKPLMGQYMRDLEDRLHQAGFPGRVFVVTSQAGLIDARDGADAPIHLINSGPAMAPIAGRYYASEDTALDTAVVADTGGTTYDVSLVRRGRIPWTRETWIGTPYIGHMTGFPSVDVRSIGAGGGSIAAVDRGGLLHRPLHQLDMLRVHLERWSVPDLVADRLTPIYLPPRRILAVHFNDCPVGLHQDEDFQNGVEHRPEARFAHPQLARALLHAPAEFELCLLGQGDVGRDADEADMLPVRAEARRARAPQPPVRAVRAFEPPLQREGLQRRFARDRLRNDPVDVVRVYPRPPVVSSRHLAVVGPEIFHVGVVDEVARPIEAGHPH